MPDALPPDQSLHLPSLVIKNFRGIDELTIPRLGRVTLLAGKNGVGKTTVLDAVRVWADRGSVHAIDILLLYKGDSFASSEDSPSITVIDRAALFTDRDYENNSLIAIGPVGDNDNSVLLSENRTNEIGQSLLPSEMSDSIGNIGISTQFGEEPIYRRTSVNHRTLGPNVPNDQIVQQYWSEVALTSHEDLALEALNMVTNQRVERVAALGPPTGNGVNQPRRMMAKVTGRDYQVPLRSLGDGALRTYAVALALAKSSGGFLLIDEAENGIHHSIQAKFWKMVLQTAQRNNVQVIATTHSWDCVTGFAQAANELEDVEGLLVRLERVPVGLRVFTYDESRLENISENGIEVR